MFRRHAQTKIEEALLDTPAVLIHGPRQAGKSTLAEQLAGRTHITLDDPIALGLALRDPAAFLKAYPPPVTIDEIQRAPGLFLPIKRLIDGRRDPGSFLLTGSANVLSLPKMSDSLAGRMEVVDLGPLSQGEIEGTGDGFVDAAFEDEFQPAAGADSELSERLLRGGFPEAVQRSERRRSDWFANYIRTILDRDVRDLSNIEALTQMPLLLSLIATRVGSTLNLSGLSVDSGIPYTTLRRYAGLLETIFMVRPVGAWSRSQDKTFTKTPKMYLNDTGLLCHLLQLDAKGIGKDPLRFAAVLENFVASELAKQCANGSVRPWLLHLRTVRQLEVDFVLESRALDVVGVEVSASETLHESDANGLRFLRELAGERFKRGVVLYLGSEVVRLDDRIVAAPISALWQTPAP